MERSWNSTPRFSTLGEIKINGGLLMGENQSLKIVVSGPMYLSSVPIVVKCSSLGNSAQRIFGERFETRRAGHRAGSFVWQISSIAVRASGVVEIRGPLRVAVV